MNPFKSKLVPENYSSEISDTVPGQSMSLNELVYRFTNGQRLLVNQRPINLYDCDEDYNFINPNIKDEDSSYTLPDIEDRVDIEEYMSEQEQKKKEIRIARKKFKEEQKKEDPMKEEEPTT